MDAFYSDHFVLPLPAGHRFPMAKYRMLRDRVAAELPQVQMREAPRASDGELALAHHPAYIRSMADGSIQQLQPAAMREIGFPWSEAMVERRGRQYGGRYPPRHGRQGRRVLCVQRRSRGCAVGAGRMGAAAPPPSTPAGGGD